MATNDLAPAGRALFRVEGHRFAAWLDTLTDGTKGVGYA